MQKIEPVRQAPIFLKFMGSFLLPLAVGLVLFYFLMQPPLDEFALMLILMGITGLVSILAIYLAYRLGWIYNSPGIRWTLMGGYILAGTLVFINVWVTARMMFASEHDLLLATVLLVFATGIALAVGYFLTEAITDRIVHLVMAARAIAHGDFSTRVTVRGKDEMARLGQSFNDMTSQLEAVEKRKQELDALHRDLIAWVSHDLRTPLTSIRAILEALGDGVVEDPQTIQRYLSTAQKDVRSLSHLIDSLFEVSQMEAGGLKLDRRVNSLSDLISDTIESFSELARRKGVTISGKVDADVDPVWMDGQRISQVLNNLVSNAVQHTPSGGSVEIRVSPLPTAIQVDVCDNGIGIQPDDLPHIFERFYRGDKARSRKTGGSGLGLAIAKGVVTAHGGQIWVESTPGGGACFSFTLPRQR
jgi:signal transduction histidine kinase